MQGRVYATIDFPGYSLRKKEKVAKTTTKCFRMSRRQGGQAEEGAEADVDGVSENHTFVVLSSIFSTT